ncbi:MAG: hypothetical protein LC114_04900 [Bryobacterales bacterium]|nr:hypothetical protein [Bryobacterales bacterium]
MLTSDKQISADMLFPATKHVGNLLRGEPANLAQYEQNPVVPTQSPEYPERSFAAAAVRYLKEPEDSANRHSPAKPTALCQRQLY